MSWSRSFPGWLGSTGAQRAGRSVVAALDPERRYRELKDELAIVDTIANRSALAEACLALGKFDEARGHYAAILAAPQGDEPSFMLGRARAEFGLGETALAVATLDELKARWPDYRSPDGHLLYARALEGAGRDEEALAELRGGRRYYPGAEPRVRQARTSARGSAASDEARALADEVARGLRRAPAHVRRAQSQWLAAAEKLARR